MLPEDFLNRMELMLQGEYPSFLASYEKERVQALRVNTGKAEREDFLGKAPFSLDPVPWCADGFYYEKGDQPGKHPYHEAGVYYIQEPSAMAPAEYLMRGFEASEHTRILDLCAAPGGKSTQIAAAMGGKGFLLCNEIHPARARILSGNIERMGISNAMVSNETPGRLADFFPGYFHAILVDAPCSGEGMFRKNEEACAEWSLSNVSLCAARQDEILDCAAWMLAGGGRLVYSTCTFAPEENEGSVSRFLKRHPEFSIERAAQKDGMKSGRPEWTCDPAEGLSGTVRMWPHCVRGEGHYLAVLKKSGGELGETSARSRNGEEPGLTEKERKQPGTGYAEWIGFARDALRNPPSGKLFRFGDQLYLAPQGMPAVKGLKVLRPGLHLGTVKKNRFEPAHALAMAIGPKDAVHSLNLAADGQEIRRYLNGETFAAGGEQGWYLITVDGYSIGWGKLAGGMMKNHYPKGLRKLLPL